ncbi:MAG: zf-HC2 domain-containing protein, partial [Acidobacteriota bacterium]
MRCELFEQLIPLYVGGDLEPHEADDLRQHLNSCARCRRLNEDFEVSQNWLTGYAVPEFDEASFAKMRDSVIGQIERQEKRRRWLGWPDLPGLKDWLLPKFSPRFVLASAAIALAVVSGLLAAVYRQQMAPAKTGGEFIADNGKKGDAKLTEKSGKTEGIT